MHGIQGKAGSLLARGSYAHHTVTTILTVPTMMILAVVVVCSGTCCWADINYCGSTCSLSSLTIEICCPANTTNLTTTSVATATTVMCDGTPSCALLASGGSPVPVPVPSLIQSFSSGCSPQTLKSAAWYPAGCFYINDLNSNALGYYSQIVFTTPSAYTQSYNSDSSCQQSKVQPTTGVGCHLLGFTGQIVLASPIFSAFNSSASSYAFGISAYQSADCSGPLTYSVFYPSGCLGLTYPVSYLMNYCTQFQAVQTVSYTTCIPSNVTITGSNGSPTTIATVWSLSACTPISQNSMLFGSQVVTCLQPPLTSTTQVTVFATATTTTTTTTSAVTMTTHSASQPPLGATTTSSISLINGTALGQQGPSNAATGTTAPDDATAGGSSSSSAIATSPGRGLTSGAIGGIVGGTLAGLVLVGGVVLVVLWKKQSLFFSRAAGGAPSTLQVPDLKTADVEMTSTVQAC